MAKECVYLSSSYLGQILNALSFCTQIFTTFPLILTVILHNNTLHAHKLHQQNETDPYVYWMCAATAASVTE